MRPTRDDVGALAVAVVTMSETLRRRAAAAVDPVDVAVLRVAAERGRVRPSQIAGELNVDASSVTRHVQALERAGRVAVARDPDDRRASLITLTALGTQTLRDLYESGVDSFAALVADWTRAEVRALTDSLSRLARSWEEKSADSEKSSSAQPVAS